jgi:hypothetical protein
MFPLFVGWLGVALGLLNPDTPILSKRGSLAIIFLLRIR